MATFYSTQVDGSSVNLALNDTGPGSPPASGVTFRKDFDQATNQALIDQYNNDPQPYAFSGNTLERDGVPVEFNPDGAYFEARGRAASLLNKVKNTNDPFTREDIADALAIAFHADGLPST